MRQEYSTFFNESKSSRADFLGNLQYEQYFTEVGQVMAKMHGKYKKLDDLREKFNEVGEDSPEILSDARRNLSDYKVDFFGQVLT